jgi:SOS-response transcriptional repressor LexA
MSIDFTTLQERLRSALWKQIQAGELTGVQLARETGFQQAHISNFLNRHRGLSLQAMDLVMKKRGFNLFDLVKNDELAPRLAMRDKADDGYENVILVDGAIAAGSPLIVQENVRDVLKFKSSFLRRLRADGATGRGDWRRFVLIKVDAREGMSMFPRLIPGAMLLIDRHYTSLRPYRKNDRNMYAVRKDGGCTIKYVELSERNLVLRPHNPDYPVDVIRMGEGESVADYAVGRVCHVSIET